MGGGGGIAAGEVTAGLSARSLLLSIEESGRGGAIVPNSNEASCFAPPCGASSSSSEESSESTTDQSSSSWRPRVRVGAADSLNAALLAFSCVKRWNGFVDTSLVLLGRGGGVEACVSWLDSCIFFKKGFFVSLSPCAGWGLVSEDVGGLATEEGGVPVCCGTGGTICGIGGAGGGAAGEAASR